MIATTSLEIWSVASDPAFQAKPLKTRDPSVWPVLLSNRASLGVRGSAEDAVFTRSTIVTRRGSGYGRIACLWPKARDYPAPMARRRNSRSDLSSIA